ncbi:glucokinase [Diaminobutyricimonas aerilata]|uniref:Glucokinase n=1 Tax=Diaminobutyricimonas aerilata TaxID=1162967 RepID=A0A2M9CMN7_9MICO|nr:ROK family protein [Diaminobutyricimonas aerilata]PJJ73163.1 glucokinase [Diaminobutyricimonas aerilata]
MTGGPTASAADSLIGVDVGGTTIKAVRVDRAGVIVAEQRALTPKPDPSGELVAGAVGDVVEALGGHGGRAVGVVVPGIVDETRGVAVLSANVGFREAPVRALLERRLGTTVAFGQDVRSGAIAEARTGAGRDVDGTLAFVAVGTGVAAALLLEGRAIVSGGWAGEIGQLVLTSGPHAGSRVEHIASASATARRAGEPDALAVARRVASGDSAATAVWQTTVEVLGESLAGIAASLAPTRIIIGGGLGQAGDLLLEPLRDDLARRLEGLRVPELVAATHGDVAAALGAAFLARDAEHRTPADPGPTHS